VAVTPEFRVETARNASKAIPRETGGILIGWRTESSIQVVGAVEVPDPFATRWHYERHHNEAEALLEAALAESGDPAIGYVGEWHTHQAPLRHSVQDRRELRSISSLASHAMALIIVARRRRTWRLHAMTALRGSIGKARIHDLRALVAK
jgi:integrative and conjugative element protein (TIGR02256 family)